MLNWIQRQLFYLTRLSNRRLCVLIALLAIVIVFSTVELLQMSQLERSGLNEMEIPLLRKSHPVAEKQTLIPSDVPQYNVESTKDLPFGKRLKLSLTRGLDVDIRELLVSVIYETNERIRVRITDAKRSRFEVPEDVLPFPRVDPKAATDRQYEFKFDAEPFSFKIVRKLDNSPIFDSAGHPLQFRDQWLSVTTGLPLDAHVYGLGERVHPLRLRKQTFTLWAADNLTPDDQNLYGHHPFYMEMRDNPKSDTPSSLAHGVFLRNANGMDVHLGDDSLKFDVIGGILDFYFFMGPDPESVIRQYHEVIGFPMMPPYWTLGFHHCRWGFKNVQELETVVSKYAQYEIPLETIWVDIDYLEDFENFHLNEKRFPTEKMQKFIEMRHKKNQHVIAIVDGAIHKRPGYRTYDRGLAADIFTKNANGNDFVGKVWPGECVFPDWTHPRAKDWWVTEVVEFLEKSLPLDGIWIDMNEAASFCDGECTPKERVKPPRKKGVYPKLPGKARKKNGFDPNFPPYSINNFGTKLPLEDKKPLEHKTISPDAKHYLSTEYNLHSLFGAYMSIYTKDALVKRYSNKRPFVLSRSTYAGSGYHVAHWLGDNHATYHDMCMSISGILAMNMFGVTMVGADIGGFFDDASDELLARWHALGAFYTFARNHNKIEQRDQGPYRSEMVASVTKRVLEMRYELIPWIYSLFYNVHSHGGTVQQPLFFVFPLERDCWAIDDQFMVGRSLMISPVLEEGATSREVYFPDAVWYNYWTGRREIVSAPGRVTLASTLVTQPVLVHLRGGVIILRQDAAMTLLDARRTPFNLLVTLDTSFSASGTFFLDDGESLNVGSAATVIRYEMKALSGRNGFEISADVQQNDFPVDQLMDHIHIWGIESCSEVTVNEKPVEFEIIQSSRQLTVRKLALAMNEKFKLNVKL
eukprot:929074_1